MPYHHERVMEKCCVRRPNPKDLFNTAKGKMEGIKKPAPLLFCGFEENQKQMSFLPSLVFVKESSQETTPESQPNSERLHSDSHD